MLERKIKYCIKELVLKFNNQERIVSKFKNKKQNKKKTSARELVT